jgi:hypothetical protein
MVSLDVVAAVGAAGALPNALAGLALEYWGRAGALGLYGNTTIALGTHSLTLYSGADPGAAVIPAGSGVQVGSTPGAVKVNEDYIGQFPIPAGSRLVHALSNPGAAATFHFRYAAT